VEGRKGMRGALPEAGGEEQEEEEEGKGKLAVFFL